MIATAALALRRPPLAARLLAVAALSWFGLFGYQLAFLAWYQAAGRVPPGRDVLQFHSGMLGDGVAAPLANTACVLVLLGLGRRVPRWRVAVYSGLGVLLSIGVHLTQARLGLVNWAMPSPYRWSGVGRVHFVVFALEMALAFLTLGTGLSNWTRVWSNRVTAFGGAAAISLGALFLLSFAADYLGR